MTDESAAARAQPVSYGVHPPKPVLTLRVGISGHRPKERTFPADALNFVPKRLAQVFGAVDNILNELKLANKDFYKEDGDRKIRHRVRLVSGLAEGADQMAVDARPNGWDLDAILPFPKSEYLKDFEKSAKPTKEDVSGAFEKAFDAASTVVELPLDPRMPLTVPSDPKEECAYWNIRSQAYARHGRFLLGQIDVLVAVWDGKREEGAGGTAEVVRGALAAGIPVIWISTLQNSDPRMVLDVGEDDRIDAPAANGLDGPLKKAIETIVSVPTVKAGTLGHSHHGHDAKQRLKDFFNETWPQRTRAVLYDLLKRCVESQWPRWSIGPQCPKTYQKEWNGFFQDAPVPGLNERQADEKSAAFTNRVRDILLPRYAWADVLAVERSHRYRSAYVACYLLAILIAAIALLGVFTTDWFDSHQTRVTYKAVLVLLELSLIMLVICIVRVGNKRRWLERWTEYRALAEMLRSARALTLIGEHGYVQSSHDLEPASSAWFLWYVRATMRELGLPHTHFSTTYQNKVLIAVETHVIDDQLAYNRPTAKSLAQMHHVLHQIGNVCFFLTALVLFLFVGGYLAYLAATLCRPQAPHWAQVVHHALYASKSYVTFLAAFLPAVGAALYGIRETGDFEGFSDRAERTADKLQELKFAVARAKRRLMLDSTTAVLVATAQVLSEDLGAWQSVYGRKQLNLPA